MLACHAPPVLPDHRLTRHEMHALANFILSLAGTGTATRERARRLE